MTSLEEGCLWNWLIERFNTSLESSHLLKCLADSLMVAIVSSIRFRQENTHQKKYTFMDISLASVKKSLLKVPQKFFLHVALAKIVLQDSIYLNNEQWGKPPMTNFDPIWIRLIELVTLPPVNWKNKKGMTLEYDFLICGTFTYSIT